MELKSLLKDAVNKKVDNIYIYPPVKKKFFGLFGSEEPSDICYRVNGKMKIVNQIFLEEYTALKESIKKEVGLGLVDVDIEDHKIYHFRNNNKSYPIKVSTKPISKNGSVITMNFNITTTKKT